ncbi:MAG: hypothetical protein IT200_13945 [Thermoleophilia bacterium]|nr:hypothetical protein [Thermoleophilia bacterium]
MAGGRRARIARSACATLLTLGFGGNGLALAQGADTRPRFVIAVLGDSYASGEGSPDVHGRHSLGGDLVAAECIPAPGCRSEVWWSPDSWFPDRDAVFPQQDDPGWQDDARRCHRSSKGPGAHAGMLLADRFPNVRVEVLDFACGGAKVVRGLVGPFVGPEAPQGAANLPAQLTALERYVDAHGGGVDAVVMNIGGNDGQFDQMVIQCLLQVFPDDDCSDNQLLTDVVERTQDQLPALPSVQAQARFSSRYAALQASLRGAAIPVSGTEGLADARPDEVYLTALPNAMHDDPPPDRPDVNPQDFCDGTQTGVLFYNTASLGESAAMESVLSAINAAMGRASERNGWIFLPGMFDDFRDHGVCADDESFFRTYADALRIQGDEGLFAFDQLGAAIVLPGAVVSPGFAHPNEAGFANRARAIAGQIEQQMRMRFRPAALQVDQAGNGRFTVSFTDTSPLLGVEFRDPDERPVPGTVWHLELDPPTGNTRTFNSLNPASGITFESDQTRRRFTVDEPEGEFTVRVQACRRLDPGQFPGVYCGPFSNAVTVASRKPGTPTDVRRLPLTGVPAASGDPAIRIAWTPGLNTPSGVRYRVSFGRFGAGCADGLASCTVLSQGGEVETQSTSTTLTLPEPGEWGFEVRACAPGAGCSARGGPLVETVSAAAGPRGRRVAPSPVGTFNVRAPRVARIGRVLPLEIAWRTPRRWTDLDRVDLVVRSRGARIGIIRFSQNDDVVRVIAAGRDSYGHPDSDGVVTAGALGVDLARTSVVRFSPSSRRVVLRLGVIPARALRGRLLTVGLQGRDDRGRQQEERVAAVIRLR